MYSRLLILSLLCSLWFNLHASTNKERLTNQIDIILAKNEIKKANLSVSLQNVSHDNPLISINSQQQRHPASVIKIITTLGALEILGPNYYWETLFFTDGIVIGNKLKGNLFIKGKGDPFLSIEDIWKIVYEFRKLGILHVEGKVFIDNTFFQNSYINKKPKSNRLYEVEPNSIMANFKWVDFHINLKNNVAEILHLSLIHI